MVLILITINHYWVNLLPWRFQEQLQVLRIMGSAGAALEDISGRLAALAQGAKALGMGRWWMKNLGKARETYVKSMENLWFLEILEVSWWNLWMKTLP